jgi:hypothetical protein
MVCRSLEWFLFIFCFSGCGVVVLDSLLVIRCASLGLVMFLSSNMLFNIGLCKSFRNNARVSVGVFMA